MQDFTDDQTPYKKKRKKKTPKKANHKHDYELVEKKQILNLREWFNYHYRCRICGKVKTELHIENKE